MVKELLVGDLKKKLEGIPDDAPVRLSSDTGVDQGEGSVIISDAYEVKYDGNHYLAIYANDTDVDVDECGESPEDYDRHYEELIKQAIDVINKADKE